MNAAKSALLHSNPSLARHWLGSRLWRKSFLTHIAQKRYFPANVSTCVDTRAGGFDLAAPYDKFNLVSINEIMTIRKSTKLHLLFCSSIFVKDQISWLRLFLHFITFTHWFISIFYGHSWIFDLLIHLYLFLTGIRESSIGLDPK